MAYTKYSLTPADNNAAPPNGAPEGMLPSGVNDTMRDMMSQIRDVGDGIRGGTYTMTAPVITGGSITGVALSGNTFTSPIITGGSINNTPIGASTANTGAFTTLAATGVTTVQAGTVSAPAITTTGDTNTGIFFPAADTIAFAEGGAEVARFNADAQFVAAAGTALLPVITTTGDVNTGIFFPTADTIAFTEGGAEAMRIDSSGNLLVGTTDSASTTGVGTKQIANSLVPYFINVTNDSTGSNYYLLYNTNATNNGYRFYVQANGGVANFSGNNTNLSDERTKENIELSSSYLDKICAIPVKTFNYKDEPAGEQKTLGVIAQDVEAVAPEFVNNAGFGETKEGETPLKSVYTTDLMFALMKSIQELKTELDTVKAELATLKA